MAARRIATLLFLVLALGSASATAAPPPPPLITNGDFENSTVLPWFTNGAARLAGPADWTAASGSQSLELFSYGFAQQTVSTTAGQRYDLSFALAGNPSAGCSPVKTLAVTWNNGEPDYGPDGTLFDFDTTGHTTASMGWQTAHVLVDAASTDTYVKFQEYGGAACGVVIDHVVMGAPSAGQTGIELATGGAYPEYGTTLPMTATVIGATAGTTPTGSVQFAVDGVPEGSPVALADGQATTSADGLEPGEHRVSASYIPDSASFTGSEVMRRVTAVKAGTSTALNVYPGPTPLGEEVVATADVTRMSPGSGQITGAVQFGDEFGPIGDPVEVDSNGLAQIGLLEDVGYHYLYATYLGDDFFGQSTGNATLEIFDPNPPPATGGTTAIATTVSMSSSKNPVNPGEAYTVTATVVPATPSDLPLDGTITFSIGTTPVGGPIPLDAGHSASVTLTAPSGATRQSIRANYSGNHDFSRSVGRLTQVTSAPPTAANPPIPELICTIAPRATRLGRLLKRGATVDISCNHAAGGQLVFRLGPTQARRLGFKTATRPVAIARGSLATGTNASFAIKATVPAKYRKRLAKAKRLALKVTFAGIDAPKKTTSVTKSLALKR